MAVQLTVTAKTGPGVQVTSRVINPASKLEIDFEKKVVRVNDQIEFDLVGVTTITDTISGVNHTLVIS